MRLQKDRSPNNQILISLQSEIDEPWSDRTYILGGNQEIPQGDVKIPSSKKKKKKKRIDSPHPLFLTSKTGQ